MRVSRAYTNGLTMDEEALNTSIRKLLKTFGVNAQREIERAVRNAASNGKLKGTDGRRDRSQIRDQGRYRVGMRHCGGTQQGAAEGAEGPASFLEIQTCG